MRKDARVFLRLWLVLAGVYAVYVIGHEFIWIKRVVFFINTHPTTYSIFQIFLPICFGLLTVLVAVLCYRFLRENSGDCKHTKK